MAAEYAGGDAPTPAGESAGETALSDGTPNTGSGASTVRLRARYPRRRSWRQSVPGHVPAQAPATDGGEPNTGAAPQEPRVESDRPRPRHGRRFPPRSNERAAGTEGQAPQDPRGEPDRRPGSRGPRYRRPGDQRPRQGGPQEPGTPQQRVPVGGPREAGAPGPERRHRLDRGPRGRSPGGPRDGQRGHGRDASARRIEQKLYALESMVDRGFEDVADEAEESGTRRVHWTIVKRTVADQKSGKPMSATYVLQRDGAETEFPNLGAARAAANKTIVHPEKLTLSKAEHAAAKNK